MKEGRLVFPNGLAYEGRWANGAFLSGKQLVVSPPERARRPSSAKKDKDVKEKTRTLEAVKEAEAQFIEPIMSDLNRPVLIY